MSDLILKKHGAHASGVASKEPDGSWRTSFLVRDLQKEIQQNRGPEFLSSEAKARDWIIQQAKYHGFSGDDVDIQIEAAE